MRRDPGGRWAHFIGISLADWRTRVGQAARFVETNPRHEMRQMWRCNHDLWLSLHTCALVNLAEQVRVLPVGTTGWC